MPTASQTRRRLLLALASQLQTIQTNQLPAGR